MKDIIVHPQGKAVYLWKSPASRAKYRRPEDMTGAVSVGTKVEVKEIMKYQGVKFAKVSCVVKHKGKDYPQKGWCMVKFLENKAVDVGGEK